MKGRKHHTEEKRCGGGRMARASGGSVEEGVKVKDGDAGADWYSGDQSNVKKEAEKATGFKKGGKVPSFIRGKESEGMKIAGDKGHARADKAPRKARASGGALSGSRDPFSTARNTSERPDFKGMKNIND